MIIPVFVKKMIVFDLLKKYPCPLQIETWE